MNYDTSQTQISQNSTQLCQSYKEHEIINLRAQMVSY